MVTYVLDSSAILRYLADEAGAAREAESIKAHLAGTCEAVVCALHWGEVAGITCKVHGKQAMELVLSRLSSFGLQIVAADADRAVLAAFIKFKRAVPYVYAFGVEFATGARDRVFVTADYDFKPASHDVKMEFLPTK